MTQKQLAERIGYKSGQSISLLEIGHKSFVTREKLEKLCEILDCTEDYLRGNTNDPHTLEHHVPSLNGNASQKRILRRPFIADTHMSYLEKRIESLSSRKVCSLDRFVDFLTQCSDSQLDLFDKLTEVFFSEEMRPKLTNTSDYIAQYIKDDILPEIVLSMIKYIHTSNIENELNLIDWTDNSSKYTVMQNLGDYKKYAKSKLYASLKRCISEAQKTVSFDSKTLQTITENAIIYLSESILNILADYAINSGLYEVHHEDPRSFIKSLRGTLSKTLVRDLQDQLNPWKRILDEQLGNPQATPNE